MKSRLLAENGNKTYVVVFETGDEVIAGLTAFAIDARLDAAHVVGIGAFSDAVVGFLDWQRRDYDRISFGEQVEVLSFVGDIALEGGQPRVHAHVVLGKRDGTAHGGHLLEAHVRPTLELIMTETPAHLRRTYDPHSRLPLLDAG